MELPANCGQAGPSTNRVSASANQVDDSFESSFRAGNLNCRSGAQSESTQTIHKSQIEILVAVVVRDVEECGLLLSARSHRAISLETGSCSRTRLPLALQLSGGRISRFSNLFCEGLQAAQSRFRDAIRFGKILSSRKRCRNDNLLSHHSTILRVNICLKRATTPTCDLKNPRSPFCRRA